jgi:hypothetical protein
MSDDKNESLRKVASYLVKLFLHPLDDEYACHQVTVPALRASTCTCSSSYQSAITDRDSQPYWNRFSVSLFHFNDQLCLFMCLMKLKGKAVPMLN